MTNRMKIALACAFAVTALHWVVSSRGTRALSKLEPVRVGDPFPTRLRGVSDFPEGCLTAFIVEPGCAGCREFARTTGPDLAAQERAHIIWVVAAGLNEATEFANSFSIPLERTFSIEAAEYAPPLSVLRTLGIRGVPTRVLVSRDGRVLDTQLGGSIPTDSVFADLCATTSD